MTRDLDPFAEHDVFEAHPPYAHDPDKSYHLSAFIEREGKELFVGFVTDDGTALNWLLLDADQTEAFGKAMVDAATRLRRNAGAV